jgi:RNA polymerase sigma factor (sigma-70 family)
MISDESLIAGLAAGDPEATTAFVRRYQARVFGLAVTIVGDAAVAEDVAQEAMLRAWRHAAAYDPRRGRVATWLLTITRNLAIDQRRLRRPEPLDPSRLEATEAMLSRPLPDQDASDEMAELRAGLAELPAEQRRPLVLAALWGFTASEISEIEGTPLGTTKTRIRSALRKMAEGRIEEGRDGSRDER